MSAGSKAGRESVRGSDADRAKREAETGRKIDAALRRARGKDLPRGHQNPASKAISDDVRAQAMKGRILTTDFADALNRAQADEGGEQ